MRAQVSSIVNYVVSIAVSVVVVGLGVVAFADRSHALDLYAWEAVEGLPPIVIPVGEGEIPEYSARRYLEGLMADPDLVRLFGGKRPLLALGNYRKIDDKDFSSRALVVANQPADYLVQDARRVMTVLTHTEREKAPVYIFPVAHDAGLTKADALEFKKEIAKRFKLVIGMGGDDTNPAITPEANRDAIDINVSRDRSEAEFIKYYYEHGDGLLAGFCRFGQLTGRVLGYKLHQDLPKDVGRRVDHSNGRLHDVELLPVEGSFLKKVFGGTRTILVNSLHHQAVDLSTNPNGPLVLIAKSADGVNEAYQTRDGRVLLFQFHPELMNLNMFTFKTGNAIMRALFRERDRVLKRAPGSCGRLFARPAS